MVGGDSTMSDDERSENSVAMDPMVVAYAETDSDADAADRLGVSEGAVTAWRRQFGVRSKCHVDYTRDALWAYDTTVDDAAAAALLRVRAAEFSHWRRRRGIAEKVAGVRQVEPPVSKADAVGVPERVLREPQAVEKKDTDAWFYDIPPVSREVPERRPGRRGGDRTGFNSMVSSRQLHGVQDSRYDSSWKAGDAFTVYARKPAERAVPKVAKVACAGCGYVPFEASVFLQHLADVHGAPKDYGPEPGGPQHASGSVERLMWEAVYRNTSSTGAAALALGVNTSTFKYWLDKQKLPPAEVRDEEVRPERVLGERPWGMRRANEGVS